MEKKILGNASQARPFTQKKKNFVFWTVVVVYGLVQAGCCVKQSDINKKHLANNFLTQKDTLQIIPLEIITFTSSVLLFLGLRRLVGLAQAHKSLQIGLNVVKTHIILYTMIHVCFTTVIAVQYAYIKSNNNSLFVVSTYIHLIVIVIVSCLMSFNAFIAIQLSTQKTEVKNKILGRSVNLVV